MDKYKILQQLSATENSDIFLVMNNETNQICVMKKLNNGGARLYSDIIGINSPNIVRVFEVTDDNTVIMEYLSGTPLSSLGRSAAEYEVREWALGLCSAVGALHGAGIIHRDIKPSNIILTDDGIIKLIDFDASRIYKSYRKKDTRNIGTDGYAPPEQYGFAQTDERSDIFTIGVVMFELLTGGKPLSELPSYNGLLKPVIEKCTRLAPEERYQSVDELKKALMLPAGDAVTAEKRRINRKALIIAAVCVFALGILLGSSVTHPLRLFQGYTARSMTDIKSIELDYGSYDESSAPIGVSSMRLEDAYINKGHAIHLYIRVSENDKDYAGKKAVLSFELYSVNGESLGTVSTEYSTGSDSDALADMYIQAYRDNEGYKFNGGTVGKIKLININI
ncbi:MAG: serine/threonine protein kinase [Clostridia bacterium]|nr:serine/threonine protein kinase [Clostridia bacterium]